MTVPVPKVDERSEREISAEVRALLSAARWPEHDQEGGFDSALIHIFARFSELIIHRLNLAPQKNFLAFLDMLGVSPLPMQAARVPLTFSMAPGTTGCAVVPAGTQVAAPPGRGEQKPVIFETEQELVVTPARLDSLLIKFGERDQYKNVGSVLLLPSDSQAALVQEAVSLTPANAQPIPHVLYVAVPLNASWPKIDKLRLRFVMERGVNPIVDARQFQWEMPTQDDPPRPVADSPKPAVNSVAASGASKKILLIPAEDSTGNLTRSGDLVFLNPQPVAPVAIDGVPGCWIACRLLTPISRSVEPANEMVRASQLPVVQQVTCEMELARQGLAIEQALYNGQRLDLTKDFFPFGERPKFGDVLYLGSREVFSDADAQITVHVELTNPESAETDTGMPNTAVHNTKLSWEFWNGQEWIKLGRSGRFLRVGEGAADAINTEFTDETKSFSEDGDVKFRFPSPPQELNLNGQKNYWVRVRIAAGNYGEELQFRKDPSAAGFVAKPVVPAPPSLKSIKLDYVVKKEAQASGILAYNDFVYLQPKSKGPFKPFTPVEAQDVPTSIFFGFAVDPPLAAKQPVSSNAATVQIPAKQGTFPNRTVSAYVTAEDAVVKSGDKDVRWSAATWEYWNGVEWRKLSVHDESQSIRRTGLLQFLSPADFTTRNEFGRERYWLRMRSEGKDFVANIRSLYLNTTTAMQSISVVNDILGTSDGKANQKFQTTQPMVLAGQKLEVREPTLPPRHERERVQADEGAGAILEVSDPTRRTHQFWVTWHQVANFFASGPRDRHYVLDHVKGEVTFGDGASGLIPPVVPGNIRMTRYRSGGGVAGNQPAQAVTKLTSAVPYIQKVVNWVPASGGTDPEADARLLQRGSRAVRHGGRAVTFEDFEDLAMLASRDVARAKCVPLYNLSLAPEARRRQPGLVSLIILPSSPDPTPVPGSEVLERVRNFIDAWRLPTVELIVVGPEYIRLDVDAEIAVDASGDTNAIDLAVRRELDRYLHPVTGGPDGGGWEFGRLPQKFDLTVLIERIAGVNHVRDLRIKTVGRPATQRSGHFLICCGQYKVAMTLEEQRATEFA